MNEKSFILYNAFISNIITFHVNSLNSVVDITQEIEHDTY